MNDSRVLEARLFPSNFGIILHLNTDGSVKNSEVAYLTPYTKEEVRQFTEEHMKEILSLNNVISIEDWKYSKVFDKTFEKTSTRMIRYQALITKGVRCQ